MIISIFFDEDEPREEQLRNSAEELYKLVWCGRKPIDSFSSAERIAFAKEFEELEKQRKEERRQFYIEQMQKKIKELEEAIAQQGNGKDVACPWKK